MSQFLCLSHIIFLLLTLSSPGSTIYNDPSSDEWMTPMSVEITEGSNPLRGNLIQGGFCPLFYTLVVPENLEIVSLNILSYLSEPSNNGSFLGMQPGETLSASPAILETNSDPINFILFNDSFIGRNDLLGILASGAPLNGASTLTEGNYALWLNETGPGARFEIEFVAASVPEPSTLTFLVLCLTSLLSYRRRSF